MRARSWLLALVIVMSIAARLSGEDFDPTRFIGLDIRSAVAALGLPQEMFTYRGTEEQKDNVVFYFPDYLYLFWYRNKVWQVRCDRRFTAPVFGLTLGESREQVERTFLRPLTSNGESLYFDLSDGDVPLRVRLVFTASVLSDLYVYRSDF
jgi:hypothetical protein